MQIDRKHIITGVKLFILITIVTFLFIFLFTIKKETFEALKKIKLYGFLLVIAVWLALIFTDGLRFSLLSYCGKKKLSVWQSAEVLFVGNFMAAVTPFQTGGLPLQLYILNKDGIPPGRATALLLVRGLLQYIPIFLFAPFVAVKLGINFPFYRIVAVYIGIVIGIGGFILFLVLLRPKRLLKTIEEKKEKNKFYKLLAWAVEEAENFLHTLKNFFTGTNYRYLLLSIVFSVIFLALYLIFPAVILFGLGVKFSLCHAVAIQLLLSAILLYMPTPGASGIAETGGVLFFSAICPKNIIGVFVLLWRLFTFYTGALIGGVISMRKIIKK